MAEVGLGEDAASESIVRHEAAGICLFYSHITPREVLHTGHNRHKPRKLTKSKKQTLECSETRGLWIANSSD